MHPREHKIIIDMLSKKMSAYIKFSFSLVGTILYIMLTKGIVQL